MKESECEYCMTHISSVNCPIHADVETCNCGPDEWCEICNGPEDWNAIRADEDNALFDYENKGHF